MEGKGEKRGGWRISRREGGEGEKKKGAGFLTGMERGKPRGTNMKRRLNRLETKKLSQKACTACRYSTLLALFSTGQKMLQEIKSSNLLDIKW